MKVSELQKLGATYNVYYNHYRIQRNSTFAFLLARENIPIVRVCEGDKTKVVSAESFERLQELYKVDEILLAENSNNNWNELGFGGILEKSLFLILPNTPLWFLLKETAILEAPCCDYSQIYDEQCINELLFRELKIRLLRNGKNKIQEVRKTEPNNSSKDDSSKDDCVVCLDQTKSMVFVPCGHLACCEKCANVQQTCPICRSIVSTKVKLFVA